MLNGRIACPSNVTRISRAIKAVSQDGIPQIVNYQLGVGSQGGIANRIVGGKNTFCACVHEASRINTSTSELY
jgi:hypothetical protein